MAIEAQVRYLDPAWLNRQDIPSIGDRESRRANTAKQTVAIADARAGLAAGEIGLDGNGFALFPHVSAVRDFQDDEEVKTVYYPEMEALVKRTVGADEVFITQHQVRTEDTSDFNKAYARFIHCDYSVATPRETSRRAIEKRGLRWRDYADCEFAWFNSWQPFDHQVLRNPLAVIDASSVTENDIVDYRYTGYANARRANIQGMDAGRSAMPVANPAHRFYYVSSMATDEVLLIKQLDTRPGFAKSCPHTSFDDPGSPPDAPPRRSIEVRMMATLR